MKALFGDDLKTKDGDGELSFLEYCEATSYRLPEVNKTKKPSAISKSLKNGLRMTEQRAKHDR